MKENTLHRIAVTMTGNALWNSGLIGVTASQTCCFPETNIRRDLTVGTDTAAYREFPTTTPPPLGIDVARGAEKPYAPQLHAALFGFNGLVVCHLIQQPNRQALRLYIIGLIGSEDLRNGRAASSVRPYDHAPIHAIYGWHHGGPK